MPSSCIGGAGEECTGLHESRTKLSAGIVGFSRAAEIIDVDCDSVVLNFLLGVWRNSVEQGIDLGTSPRARPFRVSKIEANEINVPDFELHGYLLSLRAGLVNAFSISHPRRILFSIVFLCIPVTSDHSIKGFI